MKKPARAAGNGGSGRFFLLPSRVPLARVSNRSMFSHRKFGVDIPSELYCRGQLMQTLLTWVACMLSTGCVIVPCGPGFPDCLASRVRIIDIPVGGLRISSAVVRTAAEFETILDRAISELGATAAEE